jgi:hypothetical protein
LIGLYTRIRLGSAGGQACAGRGLWAGSSENISVLHGRLISVKQMKIGTTDGTGGDLDDCISRMLNLGIGNRIDANVAFAVPT